MWREFDTVKSITQSSHVYFLLTYFAILSLRSQHTKTFVSADIFVAELLRED